MKGGDCHGASTPLIDLLLVFSLDRLIRRWCGSFLFELFSVLQYPSLCLSSQ